MSTLAQYLVERNAALSTLDLEWARRTLPLAKSDHVLLASMHKARYECIDIDAELRHESCRWLRAHALGRMGGLDLLPDGELPTRDS